MNDLIDNFLMDLVQRLLTVLDNRARRQRARRALPDLPKEKEPGVFPALLWVLFLILLLPGLVAPGHRIWP